MPQPLWNIESLENLSQIVPKGHRSSESYATENTSRDKDRGSVSKGVGSETNDSGPQGKINMERRTISDSCKLRAKRH
jgi:hypothetical protein